MGKRSVPRLIVIPDPRFRDGAGIEEMAAAALAGGAEAIQLRAKGLPEADLVALGRLLSARCRAAGRLFFVNDRADRALRCGADGVHVGPGDTAPAEARRLLGPRALVGVSVYGEGDLRQAEAIAAAYVAIGAVYPTATKEIPVTGLEGVRRLRSMTRLPIIAIGGITPANAPAAIRAGADGVAVVSFVSAAPDIDTAVRELRTSVLAALAARSAFSGRDAGSRRMRTGLI